MAHRKFQLLANSCLNECYKRIVQIFLWKPYFVSNIDSFINDIEILLTGYHRVLSSLKNVN